MDIFIYSNAFVFTFNPIIYINISMKFEGIRNFRDLGELNTNSKEKIELGKIYRSADLFNASENDTKLLKEKYHLSLIIDLRSDFEIEKKPDPVIEGVEYINIPTIDFIRAKMAHDDNEFIMGNFPLSESYRAMAKDPYVHQQLEKTLKIIDEYDYSKGSILFHCATGKDRTGILAAEIYKRHHYDWEEIVQDYLKSNEAFKDYIENAPKYVFELTKSEAKAKQTLDFYQMKRSYIDYFSYEANYMKKVVLLGDSIRQLGYGTVIHKYLNEGYEIWQPEDNCRFTSYTFRMLFDYMDKIKDADIIHWNNGLWDISVFFDDNKEFTPLPVYLDYLDRISDVLLKITPYVIFATTTPVADDYPKWNNNETIKLYNKEAIKLLKAKGIYIDDLYPLVNNDKKNMICDDKIHLSNEGKEIIAKQVAKCIKEVL